MMTTFFCLSWPPNDFVIKFNPRNVHLSILQQLCPLYISFCLRAVAILISFGLMMSQGRQFRRSSRNKSSGTALSLFQQKTKQRLVNIIISCFIWCCLSGRSSDHPLPLASDDGGGPGVCWLWVVNGSQHHFPPNFTLSPSFSSYN